ncbi:MAG: hypothetical protein ACK4NV_16220 [Pannonibacter sp.]
MLLFLEKLQALTGSDDLAGFLGSMALLEDGKPADPAAWLDWLESLELASSNARLELDR